MSGPQKAESLKEEGNVEFKKGNYLKAAGLYTKAIREDPDNALLYRYPQRREHSDMAILAIVVPLC